MNDTGRCGYEQERRRMLAELHDGVGTSLIRMLRCVQAGRLERGALEALVRDAITELRIAIDALQPEPQDAVSVLANLRHRLDDTLRSSGVTTRWRMHTGPRMAPLGPASVLSIQRIVLEAIANALKHAGARTLFVSACRSPAGVAIRIEDDGRGFDLACVVPGHGLSGMRWRAQRIGAKLTITTREGRGTRIEIVLPAPGQGGPRPTPRGAHGAPHALR